MRKVPLEQQHKAVTWARQKFGPVIESLAGQGHLSPELAAEIIEGLNGAEKTIEFFQRPDVQNLIKRNTHGG